jgi:hypothetical protein
MLTQLRKENEKRESSKPNYLCDAHRSCPSRYDDAVLLGTSAPLRLPISKVGWRGKKGGAVLKHWAAFVFV